MARPFRRRSVMFVSRAYSHDPHERIDTIGGMNSDRSRWKLTQAAAIAAIEAGTDEFFVGTGEPVVLVVVVTHGEEKYLTTDRAKTHPDELLNLPVG